MSMFENNHYRWRETYFVLFRSSHRPKLKKVQIALSALNSHYELKNLSSDNQGRFESLTLISPDDFAALDICYTDGAEVLEQGAALAQEIKPSGDELPPASLERLVQCDARFEVLHFEQLPDQPEDADEADEMLDPSALLLVLDELAKLTDGLAVDPQAGTILSNEE
jgi:hypothetical protein